MPESPSLSYAAERLFRTAFPKLTVVAPPAGIRVERDVAIPMHDGTTLRANVFRPDREGRCPVIMYAHPYGKDVLPTRTPFGYLPLKRYRFMRQPERVTFSAYTAWEAPDPGYWVPRGYVLVNLDLRGFGTSEGKGTLLSDQEATDYAEAIEWAAAQPWSSGKVGLNGVSYLAISQWKVAALRPKSLAAICPWEGWTDPYRDTAYPGGVREDGFLPFWANMTERAGHVKSRCDSSSSLTPSWTTSGPRVRRFSNASRCRRSSARASPTRASTRAVASRASAALGHSTASSTRIEAASGRPTTRLTFWRCKHASSIASSRARTTECATYRPYGSKYERRATSSTRCARSELGRLPGSAGRRSTSHPEDYTPRRRPPRRRRSSTSRTVARASTFELQRTWSSSGR